MYTLRTNCVPRYLQQNMDWLEEELGGYEDEYLIIDCPGMDHGCMFDPAEDSLGAGQIELYTHHPFLPFLVRHLNRLGIRTCAAYLIESQFMEDKYKFFRQVSPSLRPSCPLTTSSLCIEPRLRLPSAYARSSILPSLSSSAGFSRL